MYTDAARWKTFFHISFIDLKAIKHTFFITGTTNDSNSSNHVISIATNRTPSKLSFLFVCLFVWSLPSHSRIFHSNGDVTTADEGLQILTNARHSSPMSSEGSLTSHTQCDMGLPFIMVICQDPCHSQLMPSVLQWSYHYQFYDFGLSRPGIEPRAPACEANALPLTHRGGLQA